MWSAKERQIERRKKKGKMKSSIAARLSNWQKRWGRRGFREMEICTTTQMRHHSIPTIKTLWTIFLALHFLQLLLFTFHFPLSTAFCLLYGFNMRSTSSIFLYARVHTLTHTNTNKKRKGKPRSSSLRFFFFLLTVGNHAGRRRHYG